MKKTINISLAFAVAIPLAMLFWPFVTWHGITALLLRIIPAVAIQTLVLRMCKSNIVRILPTLLTVFFAIWGICLFFTSPHWSNATIGDLIGDYISPLIGCIIILFAYFLIRKKK